ncbi:MAG: hypothetical protein NC310_03075, partial [Roseburia sp.]|nr:hypothetical protein [Roseburia sp.]
YILLFCISSYYSERTILIYKNSILLKILKIVVITESIIKKIMVLWKESTDMSRLFLLFPLVLLTLIELDIESYSL